MKINNKILAYVIFVLLCILFSNLIDYLYYAVITKDTYVFTLSQGLFEPILFGLISGYLIIVKDWNKKK